MYPIVVDNFFEDPNDIRNYALSLDYNPPTDVGWLGFRCFERDEIFAKLITDKIHKVIPSSSNINTFYYCFHYSLESTKQTAPYDFHDYKIHPDFCDYAGLIYLTPNPPINTGTSFYDENRNLLSSVENVFNRMIFYNARNMHGPTDLFGDTKENGRITLTFFSNMPPSPNTRFLAS